MAPELDIVVWAPKAMSITETSLLSNRLFETAESTRPVSRQVFRMPSLKVRPLWPDVVFDDDNVTLLRSCLMKPEHLVWMEDIWTRLSMSMDDAHRQGDIM